jgi:hypothetical protein
MPAAAKIAALMEQLTQADVEAMKPAERQRFAFLCSRFAKLASSAGQKEHPASGVLARLREGERGH